jgi:non-ribosomal peptide synthetase-like protein
MTYRELEARAAVAADALRELVERSLHGVDEEPIVVLDLARDAPELYIAQLAALAVGVAFTSLDRVFPPAHVDAIIADARPIAIVTARSGPRAAPRECAPEVQRLEVDADRPLTARETQAILRPSSIDPRRLAYLIYTSGTTGTPKGVMIEHASIAHLVATDLERFRLAETDGGAQRVAQCSSPAYDSSLEETWLAFAAGATLVPLDDEVVRLGPDLVPWLARERITVLCPPPTLLRTTGCTDPAAALPDLQLLYVGGEALPHDLARLWGRGRRLENGYGPTECTVTVVRCTIDPDAIDDARAVPIGRPIDGHRAIVVDEAGAEVPVGDEGELWIAGPQLARGYRGRPETTAAKFPEHPTYGRVYRTGDLVRSGPDGLLEYLGRIDGQVKLRGYRIELPAVDAILAQCPGVRDAVAVVDDGVLVAHIVPSEPSGVLDRKAIAEACRARLPAYMVPQRFAPIERVPRTVGGKVDRKGLPPLRAATLEADRTCSGDPLEAIVRDAFARATRTSPDEGPDRDFFLDLGGDSLAAVDCLCRLRSAGLHAATVRDLYDHRTARAVAAALEGRRAPDAAADQRTAAPARGRMRSIVPWLQIGWVLATTSLGGIAAAFVALVVLPAVVAAAFADGASSSAAAALLVLLLVVGSALRLPFGIAATLAARTIAGGPVAPGRIRVGSGAWVKHWFVVHVARTIPWTAIAGTPLLPWTLRLLGARVGQRVHIDRGVDFKRGGWHLLELGDDATIARDAELCLADLEERTLVLRPISIGARAVVATRASVGGGSTIGSDAFLAPLSFIEPGTTVGAGERWDGVPARSVGPRAAVAASGPSSWSPIRHALALAAVRLLVRSIAALPLAAVALWSAWTTHAVWSSAVVADLAASIPLAETLVGVVLAVPIGLVLDALLVRALVPRRSIGHAGCTTPIAGLLGVRIFTSIGLVDDAGRWLSGTLFWPWWLRLAGMRIGRGCEISTIIDVVPSSIAIGDECFFADGIYFCPPKIEQGVYRLPPSSIGSGTFLGNHAVVPSGVAWPDGLFVGVATVAPADRRQANLGWFGHPPMELPRRDVVVADRRLTHEPSRIRFWNRVSWEAARFLLPVPPLLVGWWWFASVEEAWRSGGPLHLAVVAAAATLTGAAALLAAIVVTKWILLGRVRPGQHPLWSCWCSRWDFHYVLWGMWGRSLLDACDGTPITAWFLRAIGVRIGRGVVLGPGFSQVVDPDMLSIEDGATATCHLQAHSFEDRVLKIDRVRIGRGATVATNAVLFYGVDVGDGAVVEPHAVVMKNDRLAAGSVVAGAPAAERTAIGCPTFGSAAIRAH